MKGQVAFASPPAAATVAATVPGAAVSVLGADAGMPGVSVSVVEARELLLQGIGADAAAVAAIRREQAALDARAVELLAAAARKADQLAALPGGSLQHARRSLVAEIATTLRLPESTTSRRIDDAETLHHSLPATLTALTRGDISYQHAQAVLREAQSLPEDTRSDFENAALTHAGTQTATQLAAHARTLRERMHPNTIDDRHREARDKRAVWVENEHDGMATLVCQLPAVSAFAIDDTLDQLARALHCPEETRTHTQLRADGLVDLLLHRNGEAAERARGIRANITVTVPVLTLLGHTSDPGELLGYGPIDLDTTRRLAAAAPSFTRILTHPITRQRLTIGREHYKVPTNLRAAIILDDQTCRFPGCRRRADRCDLDHTTNWAHNGPTSLDNLAALCRKHHTLKHQTDWHVTTGDGRALHWTSPAGVQHTTRPPSTAEPSPVPGGAPVGPHQLSPTPHPSKAHHPALSRARSSPRQPPPPLPDTPPF